MPMVQVKICGVTTPEDAVAAADAGANAIGLNFYPRSPRYISYEQAAEIIRALPPFVATVGIFVDTPAAEIDQVARQLGLQAAQTYHDPPLSPERLEVRQIVAFRIKGPVDVQQLDRQLAQWRHSGKLPAAILVDAAADGQLGGTGQRIAAELLEGFAPPVRWILAGGLTPETVADAVRRYQPWGVDVASGVEIAPGRKSIDKLRRFIRAVRSTEPLPVP